MTKEEAKKKLMTNCIDCSDCHFEEKLPVELIYCGVYGIGGSNDEDRNAWVYGVVSPRKWHKGDMTCVASYVIKCDMRAWVVSFMEEIPEVIESLKAYYK